MKRSDRSAAIEWARSLLAAGDFVVLDTETTGLNRDRDDVPVAIAMIAPDGAVLVDALVNCGLSIDPGAEAIHGIDARMVAAAPMWSELRARCIEAITDKTVVVYNAAYDFQIVANADGRAEIHPDEWIVNAKNMWQCAMKQYAQFWGDWNDYRHSYRWQRLTAACAQQEIEVKSKAHSALGDCQRTLALIHAMAKADDESD